MPRLFSEGRPSKLNRELAEKIIGNMRSGCSLSTATQAAGISITTWKNWEREAEVAAMLAQRGESLTTRQKDLLDLFGRAHEARTQVEVQSLAQIRAAGQRDWRAAAWFVERRNPRDWGPPAVRAELTGKDGGPIEIESVLDRARQFVDLIEATPNGEHGAREIEA